MDTITKYRTCSLCEAMCGLAIEVKGKDILSIKGDIEDPFSKGHICPKAVGMKDIYDDPDRLKRPIKKVDGKWKEISWEVAFDEVAAKLKYMQSKYGPQSIGYYVGNPGAHNLGSLLTSPDFIRSLKTKNRFSATSIDQLPHHLAALYMYGHELLMPIPDIDRTDYWLIIGGNPLVSNGSLMTAPDCGGKIRNIQKRGGKVIVIDPRFTETARKADQHHFVKPQSDVWFLLAMVNYIFQNKRVNLRHLTNLIQREELMILEKAMHPYTIDVASTKTGIAAEIIQTLFDDFLSADKAVCYGRMGVSVVKFGSLCHWAINLINLLSGNVDREGGHMFTSPAVEVIQKKSKGKIKFNRWKSRVRKLPEFGGELPCSTIAEEIMTPGENQIKCMITNAGNPVLSTSNGKQVGDAFDQLEYMVAIDIYINETTQYADIILPPATGLEVPHYDTVFNLFAIRNTAKFSDPVIPKEDGSLYDYQIFQELTKRMIKDELPDDESAKTKVLYKLAMSPKDMIAFGLNMGGQITMDDLDNNPHGIDLGPLVPNLHKRIMTLDGKLHIASDIYIQDLERLNKTKDDNVEGLILIGRRHLRSNNSWMHNSLRMVKGRVRCTLLIHPHDAKTYKIKEDDYVTVRSRVGQVTLPAEISEEIMPGVVSIPHGWGHKRKGVKLSIAEAHAGVSCNDLTDENLIDQLTGNAAVNGVPVEIFKN
jgi:anaerobic selenocysteine-containing dehydrogenase